MNHKYRKISADLRINFNQSTPQGNLDPIVKLYSDISWRSKSAQWLFAPNRESMMNIKPHANILEKVESNDINSSVESIFVDCNLRNKRLVSHFDNIIGA